MDIKALASQLQKPEGEHGIVVGNKMNESNAQLYALTYKALDLKDAEVVLEIGFGNGKFIADLLQVANHLRYHGVDISRTMIQEATMVNRPFINQGIVNLQEASVSQLPFASETFHKVFTLNTLYFWQNPEQDIHELFRVLKKGGEVFIGIRSGMSMRQLAVTQFGFKLYEFEEVKSLLMKAGFSNVSVISEVEIHKGVENKELQLENLCITGVKPK